MVDPGPKVRRDVARRHARRLAWIVGTLCLVVLSACSDLPIGPVTDNCEYRCGH